MKSFKVQVDDNKAAFFKELLGSLGFVKFEEVDGFHEPRIYPGGNFEIRTQNAAKNRTPTRLESSHLQSEDAMKNLRNAMKAIEEMRDKSRNV
ncbi:MAG: hypothetical protein QM786_07625 [Breznakibacter sp.]